MIEAKISKIITSIYDYQRSQLDILFLNAYFKRYNDKKDSEVLKFIIIKNIWEGNEELYV